MSRAIEAAALFAVGVIAGGAVVYSTRRTPPVPAQPPVPSTPPSVPALRKDVITGEAMSEGQFPFLKGVDSFRNEEIASIWVSWTGV
jgi:hypothetical protein